MSEKRRVEHGDIVDVKIGNTTKRVWVDVVDASGWLGFVASTLSSSAEYSFNHSTDPKFVTPPEVGERWRFIETGLIVEVVSYSKQHGSVGHKAVSGEWDNAILPVCHFTKSLERC